MGDGEARRTVSGPSKIEWTGHTWNPFAGCAVLSPGCTNCYAMKMAARLDAMGQSVYKGLTKPSKAGPVWRGTVRANPDALLAPLKRRKPTTYFVNSMSDLFYELFADELIDQVFAVMALCPQHTFQVLTKRAERMRKYCARKPRMEASALIDGEIVNSWQRPWPLPNVWLGVSAERQQEADERIPHLLQTPAAVRFVSCEPLIEPIDLRTLALPREPGKFGSFVSAIATGGAGIFDHNSRRVADLPGLDWIIVGGESGSNARPMHPDWARSLRDQCEAAGVPFFFKQWGALQPTDVFGSDDICLDGQWFARVGKKAAGRLLDGREHNAMPKVTA